MLIITANFPNGETCNFGRPADLLHYMGDKGFMEVHVKVTYMFTQIAKARMTLADVQHWVEMKEED